MVVVKVVYMWGKLSFSLLNINDIRFTTLNVQIVYLALARETTIRL